MRELTMEEIDCVSGGDGQSSKVYAAGAAITGAGAVGLGVLAAVAAPEIVGPIVVAGAIYGVLSVTFGYLASQ